jgi:hypothetical protein
MAKNSKKVVSSSELKELLNGLKVRFEKNKNRHKGIEWSMVQSKLEASPEKCWSLNQMEKTGGEPDVVFFDKKTNVYTFVDCSLESPKERRSICYDQKALDTRKENKPKNSALGMAEDMGIEILNEEDYRALQQLVTVDTKTSSWIQTPDTIRKLGGALFADYRYASVFVYHNGAESYYAVRGFRGKLKV